MASLRTESAILPFQIFAGAPPVNTTSQESQPVVFVSIPTRDETQSADRSKESSVESPETTETPTALRRPAPPLKRESSVEASPGEFTDPTVNITKSESSPESPDPKEFPFNIATGDQFLDPIDPEDQNTNNLRPPPNII